MLKFLITSTATLAVAVSTQASVPNAIGPVNLTASAITADRYIFGFSRDDPGNKITLNGTTDVAVLDQGWYNNNGTHDTINRNYLVGHFSECGETSGEFRNWFAFDLSGVSGPITSASVTLNSYEVSPVASTYYLYDYIGSVNGLIDGSGGVAAFYDMATGESFGSRLYQSTDSHQYVTIKLTSAAVGSLNAAIQSGQTTWALGGASPVPEPGSYILTLAGLGFVASRCRRGACRVLSQ